MGEYIQDFAVMPYQVFKIILINLKGSQVEYCPQIITKKNYIQKMLSGKTMLLLRCRHFTWGHSEKILRNMMLWESFSPLVCDPGMSLFILVKANQQPCFILILCTKTVRVQTVQGRWPISRGLAEGDCVLEAEYLHHNLLDSGSEMVRQWK